MNLKVVISVLWVVLMTVSKCLCEENSGNRVERGGGGGGKVRRAGNYPKLRKQSDQSHSTKNKPTPKERVVLESEIKWVKATNNGVPKGALLAGYELPHYHTYIIRKPHENNTVVGKVFKKTEYLPAGHYTFGGSAFHIADYEVLVAPPTAVRWEVVLGSDIPKGAVIAGESEGESVYVGRMAWDNQLIPGRVLKSAGNCFVEYRSEIEHSSPMYEVLIEDEDDSSDDKSCA